VAGVAAAAEEAPPAQRERDRPARLERDLRGAAGVAAAEETPVRLERDLRAVAGVAAAEEMRPARLERDWRAWAAGEGPVVASC